MAREDSDLCGVIMYLETAYHNQIYAPKELKKRAAFAAKELKKLQKKLKFTHIAFTGSSGCAMAYIISMLTGIPLMYVRKDGESSHGYKIEGLGECESYIILDDFICSGETVRKVIRKVTEKCTTRNEEVPQCVGVAVYLNDFGPDHVFIKEGYYVNVHNVTLT